MGAVAVERDLQLSPRGAGEPQTCTKVRIGLDHCIDSARMADMNLGRHLAEWLRGSFAFPRCNGRGIATLFYLPKGHQSGTLEMTTLSSHLTRQSRSTLSFSFISSSMAKRKKGNQGAGGVRKKKVEIQVCVSPRHSLWLTRLVTAKSHFTTYSPSRRPNNHYSTPSNRSSTINPLTSSPRPR